MKLSNTFKTSDFFAIVTQISFLLVVGLYSWNLISNENTINLSNNIYLFSVLGIFTYLLSVLLWKKVTGVLFCPYTMFLTSFFIFQFGQAVLYVFGLSYKKYNLFQIYTQKDLLETIIYTILSTSMFSLGGLLEITFKKGKEFNIFHEDRYLNTISSMKKVGLILFLISTPIAFYLEIYQAFMSFIYGYGIIYKYNFGTNSITQTLEPLFLPSAYMLIISNIKNKKLCRLLTFILLIYAVITLFTGSRTLFIMIVLSLFWLWNSVIKPFNWNNILKLTLLSFVLMLVISTFAGTRSLENKSVSSFVEGFNNSLNDNPIVNTIGELGGSMGTFIMVKNIIPGIIPFRMGDSYLYAVFSLFPNIFHIMGPLHPSRSHAMLDAWLQEYLGLSYGPGFSMIAESYYNFGWAGIFVFLLWGFIFSKLLGYKRSENLILQPLKLFIILAIISTCFSLPRIHTLYFIRTYIYFTLVPFLMVKLSQNKISDVRNLYQITIKK